MAYVDDPNQNQQGQQVAGSTPLSSGQPTETSPASSGGSVSGSGSTPMQSSGDTSGQPQTVNKGSGKASSGQYTNIQKYVAKNKPQAQKMATAVTQDVGEQAAQIQNVAQQKQAEQNKLLQQNTQALQQGKDWASSQIQNIMNQPQETPYELQQSDIEKFQGLMKGQVGGVQNVGDLNIAKQQQEAQKLQQMTGRADTEEGRRQLLGQTFQKQGDYTRGMSGLDQLITGSDQQARQALTTGVQEQGQQLGQSLGDIQQAQRQAVLGQKQDIVNFGQDVGQMATGAESGLEGAIDTSYEQALAERAALFDPESEAYQQALTGIEGDIAERQALLGKGSYTDLLQSLVPQAINRAVSKYNINRGDAEGAANAIRDYVDKLRQFEETGKFDIEERTWDEMNDLYTKTYEGDEAQRYLDRGIGGVTHHKDRATIAALNDLVAQNLGLDSDLYGGGDYWKGGYQYGSKNYDYATSLDRLRDEYGKQLSGMASPEEILQSRIAKLGQGESIEDIKSGSDIARLETATPEQIARINALKQLTGQSDVYTPEMYQEDDYIQSSDIENLLSRFKG